MNCKQGHDITDDSKVTIKTIRGAPYRYCKQCLSASNKKYKAKAKVAKVVEAPTVSYKVESVVMRNDYPMRGNPDFSSSLRLAQTWANLFKVPYILYVEVLPDFMQSPGYNSDTVKHDAEVLVNTGQIGTLCTMGSGTTGSPSHTST